MAGHSKWSQIKRAKGATDARRSKIFTKLAREITVAVKLGGVDVDSNARLALAIKRARDANMPNDNVARAIKSASTDGKNANYERITYEGYAVGGVAVMVKCLTDNKNRTAGEIRNAFERYGGSLGVSGSVSFIFEEDLDDDGEIILRPTYETPVDPDKEADFEKFLDKLDDNDDVQEVIHNGA